MENEQIEKIYKVFLQAQEEAEKTNTNEKTEENKLENSFESLDNSNNSDNEAPEKNESLNNYLQESKAEKENLVENQHNESTGNFNTNEIVSTNNHEIKTNGEETKVNLHEKSNKNESKKAENKSLTFNPEDFVIMMTIGRGNFSEVFLVENVESKILYAMKQFLKKRIEQLKKQEEVLMEKHVMNKVTPHRNIIGFGGSYRDSVIIILCYKDNYFYIMLIILFAINYYRSFYTCCMNT